MLLSLKYPVMKKLAILLLPVLLVFSCSKDNVSKSDFPVIESDAPYSISGIKTFVTKTSGLFLYQITDKAGLEKVNFINTKGVPVFDTARTYISDVYLLDPDYIVFEGSFVSFADGKEYEAVLYCRNDSMFHSFPDKINKEMSVRFLLSGDFQKDHLRNVYYYNQKFPKNVIRLALPDFQSGSLLPQSFNKVEFLTTGKGVLLYRTGDVLPGEDKFFVRYANGGESDVTISIPLDPEFVEEGGKTAKTNLGFWQGPDKEVYLLTGWSKSAGASPETEDEFDVKDIYKISFPSNEIQYEKVISSDDPDITKFLNINRLSQYKITRKDEVLFVNKTQQGFDGVSGWAFNPETKQIRDFNLPYRKNIVGLSYSDNYIFIAFEDEIIRIAFDNFSYSSLIYLNPEAFYISKLGASNDDDVYFEAIRGSDTQRVLGKIDKFGSLIYIDESLKGSISTFLRVN
jgi:hypothetical protein